MVVPPDFHDEQRLVTHKLRVSGCNVDIERSYDTFGNVILDFTLEQVERDRRLHRLDRRRARGARWTAATSPTRSRPTRRLAEPSRLTEPDAALRGGRRRAARHGRSRARTWPSAIWHARPRALHVPLRGDDGRTARPPRRGPAASACARTTRTACSRSAGCAGCPRATSRATCWARAARTPGSRCSCRTRAMPRRSAPCPIDPTHDRARRPALRHRRRRPRLPARPAHVRHVRGAVRGRADDAQARRRHARRVRAAAQAPPARSRAARLRPSFSRCARSADRGLPTAARAPRAAAACARPARRGRTACHRPPRPG